MGTTMARNKPSQGLKLGWHASNSLFALSLKTGNILPKVWLETKHAAVDDEESSQMRLFSLWCRKSANLSSASINRYFLSPCSHSCIQPQDDAANTAKLIGIRNSTKRMIYSDFSQACQTFTYLCWHTWASSLREQWEGSWHSSQKCILRNHLSCRPVQ